MKARQRSSVSIRTILIGVLLIPPNAFWLMQMELIYGGTFPSTIPLLSTVVFSVLTLVGLGACLRWVAPTASLQQGELLTIYSMLAVATALLGTDVLQTLVHIIATPFWYATPENEWAELFGSEMPAWLTVRDMGILSGFFMGESSLYLKAHLLAWLGPALYWLGFVLVFVFVMVCLNVIVRKRWTDHERLAYPIVELPYEMTRDLTGTSVLRNRLLWAGFALAGGIDLWNGVNYLYPAVPFIPVKATNIGGIFTERPFNAIGWMPITFYPFAFGMGFIMPLALCFSCWFFYLFWRIERVFGTAVGWSTVPGFPFQAEQISGVWLALLGFALWEGRRYFADVTRRAVNRPSELDDSQEPMRYRAAAWGVVVGTALIVIFCHRAGMSVWVAFSYFFIYFAMSLTISRIRAELGPPVQNLRDAGPDSILTNLLGSRAFTKRDLSVMSMFFWINGEAYRSHPMPHQLEGFRLAERAGMSSRRLIVAMMVASGIAVFAAFWGVLHYGYKLGSAVSFWGPAATYFPLAPYRRLAGWLVNPTEPHGLAVAITGGSLAATLGMLILRTRVLWWSLHPIGLAISHAWGMNWYWFPLLISWAIKRTLLNHGGVRAYRKALPFFFGLILGEFIVGNLWSLLGIALGRRLYAFWV